jgi:hypothetical protein
MITREDILDIIKSYGRKYYDRDLYIAWCGEYIVDGKELATIIYDFIMKK